MLAQHLADDVEAGGQRRIAERRPGSSYRFPGRVPVRDFSWGRPTAMPRLTCWSRPDHAPLFLPEADQVDRGSRVSVGASARSRAQSLDDDPAAATVGVWERSKFDRYGPTSRCPNHFDLRKHKLVPPANVVFDENHNPHRLSHASNWIIDDETG